jgi:hypothetical protein
MNEKEQCKHSWQGMYIHRQGYYVNNYIAKIIPVSSGPGAVCCGTTTTQPYCGGIFWDYGQEHSLEQRIWIITGSPHLSFCRPKLLQILSPRVLSAPPPPHPCCCLTPSTHPPEPVVIDVLWGISRD